MWTPSGFEASIFLGGVALGGAFVGYCSRWAIKDHDQEAANVIKDYKTAVEVWQNKCSDLEHKSNEIDDAIIKLVSVAKIIDKLKARSRAAQEAKREQNYTAEYTSYNHETGKWEHRSASRES